MNLPRVVWVSTVDPSKPNEGKSIKAWTGVQTLHGRANVEVYGFLGIDSPEIAESGSDRGYLWHRRPVLRGFADGLASLVRREFISTHRLRRAGVETVVREQSVGADLVVLDDIALAPFAVSSRAPVLLAVHDCFSWMFLTHARLESNPVRAARKLLQALIALRYERRYYAKAAAVQVVSLRDQALLECVEPTARYVLARNLPPTDPAPVVMRRDAAIVLWVDLRVAGAVRGVEQFVATWPVDRRHELALCGRVTATEASRILSRAGQTIRYYGRLEDAGSCRMVVIPDAGGAGLKNRLLAAVFWNLPVATSTNQLWGLHELEDGAVIHERTVPALAKRLAAGGLGDASSESIDLGAFQERVRDEWQRLWRELLPRSPEPQHG